MAVGVEVHAQDPNPGTLGHQSGACKLNHFGSLGGGKKRKMGNRC